MNATQPQTQKASKGLRIHRISKRLVHAYASCVLVRAAIWFFRVTILVLFVAGTVETVIYAFGWQNQVASAKFLQWLRPPYQLMREGMEALKGTWGIVGTALGVTVPIYVSIFKCGIEVFPKKEKGEKRYQQAILQRVDSHSIVFVSLGSIAAVVYFASEIFWKGNLRITFLLSTTFLTILYSLFIGILTSERFFWHGNWVLPKAAFSLEACRMEKRIKKHSNPEDELSEDAMELIDDWAKFLNGFLPNCGLRRRPKQFFQIYRTWLSLTITCSKLIDSQLLFDRYVLLWQGLLSPAGEQNQLRVHMLSFLKQTYYRFESKAIENDALVLVWASLWCCILECYANDEHMMRILFERHFESKRLEISEKKRARLEEAEVNILLLISMCVTFRDSHPDNSENREDLYDRTFMSISARVKILQERFQNEWCNETATYLNEILRARSGYISVTDDQDPLQHLLTCNCN